jgi:hypothetical protein
MPGTLQLDTKAIIAAVVTALVVGGIGGAAGYSRVVELDSYRITANAQAIEVLKTSKVDKEVYAANLETLSNKIDALSGAILELKDSLKKR